MTTTPISHTAGSSGADCGGEHNKRFIHKTSKIHPRNVLRTIAQSYEWGRATTHNNENYMHTDNTTAMGSTCGEEGRVPRVATILGAVNSRTGIGTTAVVRYNINTGIGPLQYCDTTSTPA